MTEPTVLKATAYTAILLAPTIVFGILALVLWRFRKPGPRWPFLYLVPAGAISLFIDALYLKYGNGDIALGAILPPPLPFLLVTLRGALLGLAALTARGAHWAAAAASLAILFLDAGFFLLVFFGIACRVSYCDM